MIDHMIHIFLPRQYRTKFNAGMREVHVAPYSVPSLWPLGTLNSHCMLPAQSTIHVLYIHIHYPTTLKCETTQFFSSCILTWIIWAWGKLCIMYSQSVLWEKVWLEPTASRSLCVHVPETVWWLYSVIFVKGRCVWNVEHQPQWVR